MDEPTSSLTSVETEALHKMTRALRDQGKTIVYVSHFLDEVLELCDTVTVMRSGHLVRTGTGQRRDRGHALSPACSAPRPKPSSSRSRPPRRRP